MTTPNPLIPTLAGRQLTIDAALKRPTTIRDRIAKLADETLLLPKLFRPNGAKIEGGGLLYSVVQASDFFTARDVEQRTPGTEYTLTPGVDPETRLALVEDYGGKFPVTDEQLMRNEVNYLDQQTTQLANTIARKLDNRAMTALASAGVSIISPPTNWGNLVFVGPEAELTPTSERPTSHFADAQLAADLEELGVVHDLLLVHPTQAAELRRAYADGLDAMLKSAGLEMFVSARVPEDDAYVMQKANLGVVGFEVPLTVEVYDDREHRQRWVQAYAVPAFAPDRPYAAKRIALPA